MRYAIIGDEDAVLGFGMVGVQGRAVENREEAEAAFQRIIEEREVGVILITEPIAELIRSQLDRYLFTARFPLIVEIPDRRGPVSGKPGVRATVTEAIGIKL